MIDWESKESIVLMNPKLPKEEQEAAQQLPQQFSNLQGHVWVGTSGSSGALKWTALSKQAILVSAQAVNAHLQVTSHDRWLHVLPDFHVGGIGIWARSTLSRSLVTKYQGKWDPLEFHAQAQQVTLSALVPTQVFDLVQAQLKAPPSLRAIVVGGGALNDLLYDKATALGWNLLPSYGLTECASQVATAKKGCPHLHPLPHIQLRIEQGLICIRSEALLTGYAVKSEKGFQFTDPKKEGWFQTEDRGELQENQLHVLGRATQCIKIGGESVDLNRLDQLLEQLRISTNLQADVALIAYPDPRLGHLICLVATQPIHQSFFDQFNHSVLPFERIKKIVYVSHIPKTPLNKINKIQLMQLIG